MTLVIPAVGVAKRVKVTGVLVNEVQPTALLPFTGRPETMAFTLRETSLVFGPISAPLLAESLNGVVLRVETASAQ